MNEKEFYDETFKNLPVLTNQVINSEDMQEKVSQTFYEFLEMQHVYDSAIEVVKTYLNILDGEFSVKFQRNPIHNIESRLKSPQSIIGKLRKKNLPVTTEAARKNLLDMAGIRVTCYYISDIYAIADLLSQRDDFVIIKKKDYIRNPKPSGYRSFHMIINVPVYLATRKTYAPVEIQIRTIAMDFWASLEHQLKYKTSSTIPPQLSEQLRMCADKIAETDEQMQDIFSQLNEI
ncbi:MAG: GTP pyrophosphokinase family protein [Ruminococcus sp.]|nr:GTP pyrophosphokinase family protein [Oscillospiraceae bacterium]